VASGASFERRKNANKSAGKPQQACSTFTFELNSKGQALTHRIPVPSHPTLAAPITRGADGWWPSRDALCTRGAARERGTPTVKAAGCPRPSDGDSRTAKLIVEHEDVLALPRGDKQALRVVCLCVHESGLAAAHAIGERLQILGATVGQQALHQLALAAVAAVRPWRTLHAH